MNTDKTITIYCKWQLFMSCYMFDIILTRNPFQHFALLLDTDRRSVKRRNCKVKCFSPMSQCLKDCLISIISKVVSGKWLVNLNKTAEIVINFCGYLLYIYHYHYMVTCIVYCWIMFNDSNNYIGSEQKSIAFSCQFQRKYLDICT